MTAKKKPQEKPKPPNHILIEGDNLHALTVLNYTHAGKIDAMYFDPPYNTGNRSWKYNNDYVERDDAYKHSKWLSFMNKRLKIAKRLLSSDGIIVVTIDDYEVSPLVILMDEIFGEEKRLAIITVENKPSGRTTDKYYATSHGTKLLESILGKARAFDFPKSIFAVKDTLDILSAP